MEEKRNQYARKAGVVNHKVKKGVECEYVRSEGAQENGRRDRVYWSRCLGSCDAIERPQDASCKTRVLINDALCCTQNHHAKLLSHLPNPTSDTKYGIRGGLGAAECRLRAHDASYPSFAPSLLPYFLRLNRKSRKKKLAHLSKGTNLLRKHRRLFHESLLRLPASWMLLDVCRNC